MKKALSSITASLLLLTALALVVAGQSFRVLGSVKRPDHTA